MKTDINTAYQILLDALDTNQSTFLLGSPGVGKSAIVKQAAMHRKIDLVDIRLSQMDSVDLRGVPSVANGRTVWNQPNNLPTEGKGILFLDEITSATQAVQASSYQLVLDRRLGEYIVPDGWSVIAAGNRVTDHAIVNRMSSALKNRFMTVDIETSLDPWIKWAYQNNIHNSIIGFLRFRPELLNVFETPKQFDATADSFATQRSWEMLSKFVDKSTPNTLLVKACGLVGDGPATEFISFSNIYNKLPDIDVILASPSTAKLPNSPSAQYAVTALLAVHAKKANWSQIMVYTKRLPVEYQVLVVKDSTKKDPILTSTQEFIQWATENRDVVF